jgi:hypothetical protein
MQLLTVLPTTGELAKHESRWTVPEKSAKHKVEAGLSKAAPKPLSDLQSRK